MSAECAPFGIANAMRFDWRVQGMLAQRQYDLQPYRYNAVFDGGRQDAHSAGE